MMSLRLYGVMATCLLLLTGCDTDYEAMAKDRAEYAKMNHGDIVIAAIQDPDKVNYNNGIALAIEEINQSDGGLLGRPLKLYLEQDHYDFRSAKATIRRITDNPKISVVLGHRNDKVANLASVIYEKSQLLFFPPMTISEELTSRGALFTFHTLANNLHMANQISTIADKLNYRKIAILHARADKHRGVALLFEQAATQKSINLTFNHSFFSKTNDYRPLLSSLKENDFDAIFLSAGVKASLRLINQMREMDIYSPILGSSELDTQEFKASVVDVGHKIIIPTPYNVLAETPINQNFVARYRDKYKQAPDADAAQGYDSVMLFSNKVTRAQTTQPALLKSIVRFSRPWVGTTGVYRFNVEGSIEGRDYFFQTLHNQKWQLFSSTFDSWNKMLELVGKH